MRQSLGSKAVLAALQKGDPGPLISFHKQTFGNLLMEGDADADGDDDGDDGEGEEDSDDDDADGGDDNDGDKGKKQTDREKQVLKDENARRRKEAAALKKQNDELAAKLKKFEDADKGDLEKAQGALKEVTEERDTLSKQVQDLLIQNAFLKDNKFTWANPTTALRLADLSEVEIDEEGNVTGLAEALQKLAKEEPYLLKSKKDDDGDDNDDSGRPTGQPVGKKSKGNANRDNLVKKYPALRR